MQESDSHPTIIYILGTGHSGSTLLELILSTAPQCFSVGGFRYLDRFVKGEPGVTHDDSGHTASTSPMWSEIAARHDEYIVTDQVEHTLSWKNKLSILFRDQPYEAVRNYADDVLIPEVQRLASEVSGVSVTHIINSSKTLRRLLNIRSHTEYKVYVIHLVRDVRGVVNSNRKHGRSVWHSAQYWFTDNLYARRYLSHAVPKEEQMFIAYEAFVKNPISYIEAINAWTGISVDAEHFLEELKSQPSYRFAGNEMRRHAITEIRQDERWHTELPLFFRWFFAPLNLLIK